MVIQGCDRKGRDGGTYTNRLMQFKSQILTTNNVNKNNNKCKMRIITTNKNFVINK